MHKKEQYHTISRKKLVLGKDKDIKDNQAKKSVRWMPWHQEPMKDVVSDKPWEPQAGFEPWISEWGNLARAMSITRM